MSHIEHEGAYQRAIQRNIFQNARKTFNRVYPRAEEVASFLLSNTKNEFLNIMYKNLFIEYGKLTEKQYIAVCNCIDTFEQRKEERQKIYAIERAKSNFVGEVGKRLIFSDITVEKVITVEAPQFYYNDRASQEIYLLKDNEGNRLVYRTKNYIELILEELSQPKPKFNTIRQILANSDVSDYTELFKSLYDNSSKYLKDKEGSGFS